MGKCTEGWGGQNAKNVKNHGGEWKGAVRARGECGCRGGQSYITENNKRAQTKKDQTKKKITKK